MTVSQASTPIGLIVATPATHLCPVAAVVKGTRVELSAENSVRLSMKECELLHLFMLNPGRPLSADYILEHVWRADDAADADTVHLYVRYLRRKLSGVAAAAQIGGDRGAEYILTEA